MTYRLVVHILIRSPSPNQNSTMKPIQLLFISLFLSLTAHASEPAQFKGMVNLHNQVRAKHQQKPLQWSDSLANYAQQWVNHLASEQNCSMIHRPNQGGGRFQQTHGENLFWASPEELANGIKKQQQFTAKDIVNAWAEEENYYDYQSNKCQAGEDCGHYTQMVWHESQKMGCAMAVCPDKSQILACNYHPRGNYIGEWPY